MSCSEIWCLAMCGAERAGAAWADRAGAKRAAADGCELRTWAGNQSEAGSGPSRAGRAPGRLRPGRWPACVRVCRIARHVWVCGWNMSAS
eukprot:360278-Rhodomonas_salina.2